jgi:hypothetical protein
MRVRSWQACAEFTIFARFRATGETTHCQRFLLCDVHAYTMHGCQPTRWPIVTIAQSSPRRIIIVESVPEESGSPGKLGLGDGCR